MERELGVGCPVLTASSRRFGFPLCSMDESLWRSRDPQKILGGPSRSENVKGKQLYAKDEKPSSSCSYHLPFPCVGGYGHECPSPEKNDNSGYRDGDKHAAGQEVRRQYLHSAILY